MEAIKETFYITKNTLFDWNIIEKKTKIQEVNNDAKNDAKNDANNDANDLLSTIEKQDSSKILDIKRDIHLKEISVYNTLNLRNIDNLIDKIELLERKINKLEALSKNNNYSQLLSPYLGGLNYPFNTFYLHKCRLDEPIDDNVD